MCTFIHCNPPDLLPEKMLVSYGDRMTQDNFEGATGFALEGGIKDASNIRRLTNELNSPMPTVDIAHQRLLTTRALHQQTTAAKTNKFETLDWSAIVAGSRVAAGLDAFDTQKVSIAASLGLSIVDF
jgi:3-hydroxyisobutyrate dehydrogenase-like beta-hydroxyacid dehydrogenase